ncbi:hypothetical protein GSI_14710 [Ganoderma sinense ZZ0214-1]|uniref:Uncharacterized protein n=1 Tax=Ganoderma sinense ZZ0214-1 TaxID=1077348 RepID=A0A2G8RPG5_9APHY|nr:hypothetical protein GSI_14710 [Ganoderma sinense ZZ0214-1]
MSETTTRLACLPEASADLLSVSALKTSAGNLAIVLYRGSLNPGFVVIGLASVFFAFSLALFAICTDLVDMDLKLENAYFRYILFLDRLCDRFLTIVDVVGEAFLALPSRIVSEFIDSIVSFSKFTLATLSWTLRIFVQGVGAPYRHARPVINLPYVTGLDVQGGALTICAPSRNFRLAEHLCRIPLHEARRHALDLTRECFLLGAEWMYALGRSLYSIICAGAALALAVAVQLPSRRTYCRAWSGAMRSRGQQATLPQPDSSQLHRGEALLAWCVQRGESPAPQRDVDPHPEMSFSVTLDLDIDEDGELRVAFVPDTPMRCSTTTVRVLCDAETQTEDRGPGAEEIETHTEAARVSVAPAEPEGSKACARMDGLAPRTGFRATPSATIQTPVFPSRAFTFKFNPQAPTFSPARPASPPIASRIRHAFDGRCDTTRPGMRLNPLAEEFKAPGRGWDAETNSCTLAGDRALTLPPYCRVSKSKAVVLRADLSRVLRDAPAVMSAPSRLDSGQRQRVH